MSLDYLNHVLTTFLGLERIAAYGGSESTQISSKMSTFCVFMMNEGLGGLEQQEVIINDRIFPFK